MRNHDGDTTRDVPADERSAEHADWLAKHEERVRLLKNEAAKASEDVSFWINQAEKAYERWFETTRELAYEFNCRKVREGICRSEEVDGEAARHAEEKIAEPEPVERQLSTGLYLWVVDVDCPDPPVCP